MNWSLQPEGIPADFPTTRRFTSASNKLDRKRIIAISLVAVGHIILLGLMARTTPPVPFFSDQGPDEAILIDYVMAPKPPKLPEPVVVETKVNPVVKTDPVVAPAPAAPVQTEAQLADATSKEPTEDLGLQIPSVPVPTAETSLGSVERALQVLESPAPIYPASVLRQGGSGTVHYRVLVGQNGRALEVKIDKTSGNRQLDRIVKEHIKRRWKFRPMQENGVEVDAWGQGKVRFVLGNG